MRSKSNSTWALIALLVVGVILGSLIGDLIGDKIEFLSKSYSIGLKSPIHLDLKVLDLTFGLMLDINVASIIGIIIAILIYKKI